MPRGESSAGDSGKFSEARESIPVDGQAAGPSASDPDPTFSFPPEVLDCALVLPQERLELLEATAVVVLCHKREALSDRKNMRKIGNAP